MTFFSTLTEISIQSASYGHNGVGHFMDFMDVSVPTSAVVIVIFHVYE